MDFALPTDLVDYLQELDDFIEREIIPLEEADDNIRFFEIQMRRVAGYLFGFMKQRAPKGV